MRPLSDYPKGVMRVIRRKQKARKDVEVLKKYSASGLYYVIRPHVENCGLATIIRSVESNTKYALERGWIPVVDYQTYANPYLYEHEVGKVNAWEYFFEQPARVSLQDIKGKENVLVTEDIEKEVSPTDSMEFYTNPYALAYWRKLYKENIRLNEETAKHIQEQRIKLFGSEETSVLGCVVRGTDYIGTRPKNHPVQPSADVVLAKAQEVMQEREYDKLFLATEDARVLEKFQKVFGEKLVYVEQQRYSDGSVVLSKLKEFAAESSKQHEGLQYLTAIYLLASCNAMIGGRCGITTNAHVISQGYEYEYLWNLGRYRTDDYCLPQEYL